MFLADPGNKTLVVAHVVGNGTPVVAHIVVLPEKVLLFPVKILKQLKKIKPFLL